MSSRFIRFYDLKERGIVKSWAQLDMRMADGRECARIRAENRRPRESSRSFSGAYRETKAEAEEAPRAENHRPAHGFRKFDCRVKERPVSQRFRLRPAGPCRRAARRPGRRSARDRRVFVNPHAGGAGQAEPDATLRRDLGGFLKPRRALPFRMAVERDRGGARPERRARAIASGIERSQLRSLREAKPP
jgi:hypothetical protein